METDPKLLEILVCPLTKTRLHYDRERQELVSRAAGLAYPIRGGVPVMLPDEARPLSDEEVPRERLLAALKSYLNSRDMQADWKSVMTAPAEALVNALAMMCPFDPAEKQALLEAQSFQDRATTLLALLEMGGGSGSTTVN